jgi:23S rRNA (uracil1939-C5)-methyltransferase
LRPKSRYGKILENVTIESAGAEGNCIARWDGRVIFVKYAAPGDVCDLKIYGSKKKFLLAEIVKIIKPSDDRIEHFCEHFGTCGGCKWQHLSYEAQLSFKTKQVKDSFDRIGKLNYDAVPAALPSEQTQFYRNKLEFTFSDNRWLTQAVMDGEEFVKEDGLGFHIPGRWDKIVHVNKCWLQDDTSNRIRNFCFQWVQENNLSCYNPRSKEGLMRNLMLRNTLAGDWMVLLTFHEESEAIDPMLNAIRQEFPEIKSLLYSINEKVNDSIYDLTIQKFSGEEYLEEELQGLRFKIRPKSFFQTNPKQAETLYSTAINLADIQPKEIVYDLYCGTGTISLIAAKRAGKVVGIESVKQAVEDAKENALMNNIGNVDFVVGDMKDIFNDSFQQLHGKPDIIITDPPRAGMHKNVIDQIIRSKADKLVYVSCNPATQARDLDLLREHYQIEEIQPVDMFPHTHHVENVAVLKRIN